MTDDEQLQLRYQHAQQANLHVDGQIQAADRKGAFLIPVNAAIFVLLSADLAPKVRASEVLAGYCPLKTMVILALLGSLGLLIASYVCIYALVKARLDQDEYQGGWPEDYKPEELIYFGAVADAPRKEYVDRYARLDRRAAWVDLSFQVYKQARIVAKKYKWFGRARLTSALAGLVALVAALILNLVS